MRAEMFIKHYAIAAHYALLLPDIVDPFRNWFNAAHNNKNIVETQMMEDFDAQNNS
jgi:hypothetical protein